MPGTTGSSTNGSQASSNGSGSTSQPNSSEASESLSWREKILRQQMLIRQSHEGMMMEKIMRQNRIVEDNARNQMNDAYGTESGDDEEDMGVSIGKETHTHYHTPGGQPPQGNAGLKAALIATSLLATGSVGGLAGYLLNRPSAEPAAVQEIEDNDTITNVAPGFGQPEFKD